MIIKSHIRGGYRSAAEYLKEQGLNEKTRLVEISDPEAKNLDDAFHNMWVVASNTKATKPLHHISINPMKDERLTDKQVLAIVQRCEEKYGYKMFHHQRVIVEHIRDGRQHFHVIWNRVSLMTGRTVWPGEHWKKSKQVCREMERELGLKRPTPKRIRKSSYVRKSGGLHRMGGYAHKMGRHPRSLGHKTALNMPGRYNNLGETRPPSVNLVYIKPSKETSVSTSAPFRPVGSKRGWPPAAILDWASWGSKNPRRFFALWPELSI